MTRLHPATAALALALVVTACGSGADDGGGAPQDHVEVSGDFESKPTIEIDDPLKVSESTSWATTEGKGDKVGEDATTILQLTIADGRTGETVVSTHDQGQRPLEIDLTQQVFPSLARGLVGERADSRVVVASTADDAYGENGAPQIGIEGGDPVVMVADILSTDPTSVLDGPTGRTRTPPAGAPELVLRDGTPAGFDFDKARKPRKLVVATLREGTGPEVESPDRVTADYLGAVWGAKKPFDQTFTKEPSSYSIGLGRVLRAWDEALEGVKEGGRVMIISPPALAYGKEPQWPSSVDEEPSGAPDIPANSTLVFVLDVLGVG